MSNTFIVKHRDGKISTYRDITYISVSLGIWTLFRGKEMVAVLDRLDSLDYDIPARKTTAYEDEV